MTAFKTIFFICVGWVMTFVYLFLPENRFAKPFPFNPQEISLQAYFDYAMSRITYIVLTWLICSNYDRFEFKIVFYLMIGYLIDYILCYNQPFMYLNLSGMIFTELKPSGFYLPIGYPLLMLLIFIGLIIKIGITG